MIATVISFVVGYAVIVWFLKLISTRSYMPFVVYRIALAIAAGRPAGRRIPLRLLRPPR